MQIALLQTNPHLGNYANNLENFADLIARQNIASDVQSLLCLSSSFALCGNPWEAISSLPAFSNRMQENSAKLSQSSFQILVQNFLPQTRDGAHIQEYSTAGQNAQLYPFGKPVWQLQGRKNTKIFIENFFEIDGLGIFAPHNVALEDFEKLLIPAEANLIYLACAHQFYEGIEEKIENALIRLAKRVSTPVVYVNTVGATDGIVFAGQSMLLDAAGKVLARLKNFEEDFLLFELSALDVSCTPKLSPKLEKDAALFFAASLAIKDYARKTGIKQAVIGISGGMDSALVATLTCEALGAENVTGLMMPSKFSSDGSVIDATKLLQNLGMQYHIIPISDITKSYETTLSPYLASLPPFKNPEADVTHDNLQARTRGNLLMAFANRLGAMVIGTGNKSEAAMGYCTLYGDTVGALEPISDIYKTRVYSVARWYNSWKNKEIIPQNIFDKAPSAELRPDQKDEDSLPPYPLLDYVLEQILEQGRDPFTISIPSYCEIGKLDKSSKMPEEEAKRIVDFIVTRLVQSEFKRKQSPFVISLTGRAFGDYWALPISTKVY